MSGIIDLNSPHLPSDSSRHSNNSPYILSGFTECPICLDSIHSSGYHSLVTTTCGHVYGKECLKQALKHKNECPKCRENFNKKRKIAFVSIFDIPQKVVDTDAAKSLEHRLHEETNLRQKANIEINRLKARLKTAEIDTNRLKNNLARMQQELTNYQDKKVNAECRCSKDTYHNNSSNTYINERGKRSRADDDYTDMHRSIASPIDNQFNRNSPKHNHQNHHPHPNNVYPPHPLVFHPYIPAFTPNQSSLSPWTANHPPTHPYGNSFTFAPPQRISPYEQTYSEIRWGDDHPDAPPRYPPQREQWR